MYTKLKSQFLGVVLHGDSSTGYRNARFCLGTTGAMHTTATNAVEALIWLPLELMVQREAWSAARIVSGVWGAGVTYTSVENIVLS